MRLDTRQNVAALAFPGRRAAPAASAASAACSFPPLEDTAEVCVHGARLDEDLYTGSFGELLAAYEAQAGKPRRAAALGARADQVARRVDGPGEVLEDMQRFQAAGIPLGWVLLDNPWETVQRHARVRPHPDPRPRPG